MAILYHHTPENAGREHEPPDPRLIAFGMLAEQIVALGAGRGLCPDWRENEAFVLDTLRIDADEVVGLMQELELAEA